MYRSKIDCPIDNPLLFFLDQILDDLMDIHRAVCVMWWHHDYIDLTPLVTSESFRGESWGAEVGSTWRATVQPERNPPMVTVRVRLLRVNHLLKIHFSQSHLFRVQLINRCGPEMTWYLPFCVSSLVEIMPWDEQKTLESFVPIFQLPSFIWCQAFC